MKLTDTQRDSAVWKAIKEHLESKLTKLRARNDKDTDATETAKLRGRIAEVKDLLSLDKEPVDAPD